MARAKRLVSRHISKLVSPNKIQLMAGTSLKVLNSIPLEPDRHEIAEKKGNEVFEFFHKQCAAATIAVASIFWEHSASLSVECTELKMRGLSSFLGYILDIHHTHQLGTLEQIFMKPIVQRVMFNAQRAMGDTVIKRLGQKRTANNVLMYYQFLTEDSTEAYFAQNPRKRDNNILGNQPSPEDT